MMQHGEQTERSARLQRSWQPLAPASPRAGRRRSLERTGIHTACYRPRRRRCPWLESKGKRGSASCRVSSARARYQRRSPVLIQSSQDSSSETVGGHQRPPETIRDNQRPSEPIRAHQRSSETVGGHQRPSEATRSHFRRSPLRSSRGISLCDGAAHTTVGATRLAPQRCTTVWL